jgi:hypothetical protein
MLSIVVLLVGGLMAVNEAPGILILDDDISNDCEAVQVTRRDPRGCIVADSTGQAVPARVLFSNSPSNGRGSTPNSLFSSSSRSPGSLLLMLVTQRK